MSDKKENIRTQPALIGDKVYLRPATAEDIANTYHWFLQSDPTMLNCEPAVFQTAAEAADSFRKEDRTPDAQRFMIVDQKVSKPVGWIRFFDLNALNRSTQLDLLVDPDEREKGYASESIRLLCNYLFRSRGLNRVWAQISAGNTYAVKMLEKAGFKKDGTLRHHYFHKGEFCDGLIYSLLLFEFER